MLVQQLINGELLKGHLRFLTDDQADLALIQSEISLVTTINIPEDDRLPAGTCNDSSLEDAFRKLHAAKSLYFDNVAFKKVRAEYINRIERLYESHIVTGEKKSLNSIIDGNRLLTKRQIKILKCLIHYSCLDYQRLRSALIEDIMPKPYAALDAELFDQLLASHCE